MARRFGRNQKRAMQRELENCQQAHAMTEGLLKHVGRQRDRLQDDLETVRSALGPKFVGLPVAEAAIEVGELYRDDTFRLAVDEGVVTMHAMRIEVASTSDNPKLHLHIRVRLAGGEVCYAMSEQALFGMKAEADSVIVGHLVRELAPYLLRVVREKRGRR